VLELVNARVRGQIGEAQKDVRCVCVDLTCAPSEFRNQRHYVYQKLLPEWPGRSPN